MIKTVIFDFDGTIADTLVAVVKLFNIHANEFGFPKLKKLDVEKLRGQEIKEVIKEYGISLIKIPFIVNKIRTELKKQISKLKLFLGVKQMLLNLKEKDYRLGILSSNSKENIEEFLNVNNIQIFDFIHSESNIFGKDKSLKNLLKKNNLKSDETIYVGDEIRDIDACKSTRIKIVAVTWGFNKKEILEENKPDYLIDKPDEILGIVDKN